MGPNEGTVAGDFRLLVRQMSTDGWVWWPAAVVAAISGAAWELTVSPAGSPEVIARRSFRRRRDAERVRQTFARAAADGRIHLLDAAAIERIVTETAP